MKLPSSLLLALATALVTGPAAAVDMTPMAEPEAAAPIDKLAAARRHIQAQRWPDALAELKRANDNGNADWNNLMGYAQRKQAKPDLDAAQKHYDAALRINPQHQGALEYAGELALMKKDLATAEAHLATLSRLCKSPCEPLDDLKKAVAAYKAANKS